LAAGQAKTAPASWPRSCFHSNTEPEAMLGLLADVRAQFGTIPSALELSEPVITRLQTRHLDD
jgi:hypothetical protein